MTNLSKIKTFFTPRITVLVCLAILIFLVAVLAPLISPYDILKSDYASSLDGPSAAHIFGCDNMGRDEFSRVLYGTRVSVFMSLGAVLITAAIGTIVGLLAGTFGGWLDNVIMRISDIFMAFPEIVLGVAIVGLLGPNIANAMIAVIAVMWVRFARIARSLSLSLKESDFITTARLSGCS